MGLFRRIRDYFRRTPKPQTRADVSSDNVDHPDPLARDVIAQCFNSGHMIIGNRNDDGTVEIKDFGPPPKRGQEKP